MHNLTKKQAARALLHVAITSGPLWQEYICKRVAKERSLYLAEEIATNFYAMWRSGIYLLPEHEFRVWDKPEIDPFVEAALPQYQRQPDHYDCINSRIVAISLAVHCVRNNTTIEDIHCEGHLSDSDMAEWNRYCNNRIYTAILVDPKRLKHVDVPSDVPVPNKDDNLVHLYRQLGGFPAFGSLYQGRHFLMMSSKSATDDLSCLWKHDVSGGDVD